VEHIERIRYPNPLPLPPYPPKLLSIPTPSSRYADPRTFGTRLATAQPLPMVVDLEAGMPLNMSDFPQAWYTDQEIEVDDNLFPRLETADDVDDEDAFLLSDLLGKLPSTAKNVGRGTVGATNTASGNVTWLRRTEYLGAEKKKKEREAIASRSHIEQIDSSREAQLARIKESFEMANKPLSSIRHPTRPGLKAVEEHRLLPDPETWASRYDVFRFGDPPGRTLVSVLLAGIFHYTALLTDMLSSGQQANCRSSIADCHLTTSL
jgi:RNA polymerase II-associated factor 1